MYSNERTKCVNEKREKQGRSFRRILFEICDVLCQFITKAFGSNNNEKINSSVNVKIQK